MLIKQNRTVAEKSGQVSIQIVLDKGEEFASY